MRKESTVGRAEQVVGGGHDALKSCARFPAGGVVGAVMIAFASLAWPADSGATCPPTRAEETLLVYPATPYDMDGPVIRASRYYGADYAIGYGFCYYCMLPTGFGEIRFYHSQDHGLAGLDFPVAGEIVYFGPDITSLSSAGSNRWIYSWQSGPIGDPSATFNRFAVYSSGYQRQGLFELRPSGYAGDTTSVASFPVSGGFAYLWAYRDADGLTTVVCDVRDSAGNYVTRNNLDSFYSPNPFAHPTHVAIQSFWYSSERLVAAWTRPDETGGTTLYAQVLSAACSPLSQVVEVDPDPVDPLLAYPGIAATGNGFVLVWTGRDDQDQQEVFYQIFYQNGNPYGDKTRVDPSITGPRYSPRVAGAVWAPTGGGQRPAFYFLVTWGRTDQATSWFHTEMKLIKGLFPPVAVTGILPVTDPSPNYSAGHRGVSAEFFTDCSADLRAGLVWSEVALWVNVLLQRRFVAFSPGGAVAQNQPVLPTDSSGVEAALPDVISAPAMGIDNPKEPDVILYPGHEFDSGVM